MVQLIAFNLAGALGLLLLLNAVSFVALRGNLLRPDLLEEQGVLHSSWKLPNYPDKEHAKRIFAEFRQLRSRYEPFVGWSRMPFSGATTTIAATGDRVHPRSVPSGAQPVARFFGGSTMWGTGADDEGTIPAYFDRSNAGFVVHNHGETAFTSRQALDRLISLLSMNERADLVVFFDGVNDVSQQCRLEVQVPGHSRVAQFRSAIEEIGDEPRLGAALLRVVRGVLFEYTLRALQAAASRWSREDAPPRGPGARDRAPGLRGYDCDDDPRKAERVARALLQNWEIAHDVVTRRGGRFLAILQPTAHTGSPRVAHLEREGRLDPEIGKNLRAVYPLVAAEITSRGEPWMADLTDAYDETRNPGAYILIDDFHVSANGNAIIARRIEELLQGGLASARR